MSENTYAPHVTRPSIIVPPLDPTLVVRPLTRTNVGRTEGEWTIGKVPRRIRSE